MWSQLEPRQITMEWPIRIFWKFTRRITLCWATFPNISILSRAWLKLALQAVTTLQGLSWTPSGICRDFHKLCSVFVEAGVCTAISLPHQHALKNFYHVIHLFGSPNGLCLSITESKNIQVVKQPWWRLSQYLALTQMLMTLQHGDVSTASAFWGQWDVAGVLLWCII